jgi:hypothetical protein
MKPVEHDLKFIEEGLPQVREYLLSKELYWPLGADLPRLTLGNLLLSMRRVAALRPSPQVERRRLELETLQARWRSAWEQKAARETENRLRLWTTFLSEYRASPEQYADSYPGEVRGRVILQLLGASLPDQDALLKSHLVPAGFLWEAGLEPAFPKQDFWFLYAKLHP